MKPEVRERLLWVQLYQQTGDAGLVCLIPGDRVQLDTCKIAPGYYQYTAVDDCTRYRVLEIFRRRTATSTLTFLERVLEQTPFPLQRIQTDRGRELFAGDRATVADGPLHQIPSYYACITTPKCQSGAFPED